MSANIEEPQVPPRNDRLGKTGERIVRLALEDKFGETYVDENIQGPGQRGKGADYVDKVSKLAIEVKLWIDASKSVGGYADFKENILKRLQRYRKKNGWKPILILIGKKPVEWTRIVRWCNLNKIQPYYVPFSATDSLSRMAERDDFDVEVYATSAYRCELKDPLRMILSLALGEFRELNDAEWKAVEPLLPWKKMGYYENEGRWRMGHRMAKASERDMLNGLLKLCSVNGRAREFLPKYGAWHTAASRKRMWVADGTWDEIILVLSRLGFPASQTGQTRQGDLRRDN